MLLEDYIKLFKEELDSFELTWKEGHKEDPDYYPLEMDLLKWDDLFILHQKLHYT